MNHPAFEGMHLNVPAYVKHENLVDWVTEVAALTEASDSPVLALIAVALAFAAVNWEVGLMVVGYGVAQMAYSLGLKQIVIIDVMTLAGLFILRVAAGASAVDAHASEWLLLCTGMLAAFLGFTKRRQEAVSELHEGTTTRPVLEHYSLPFLDQMVSLVTTGTVISYAIYTVNSPIVGNEMMWTIPPVRLRDLPLPLPDLRPRRRPLDVRRSSPATRGIQAAGAALRAGRLPAALRLQLAAQAGQLGTSRARPPSGRSGRGRAPRRRPGRRRRGGRRSRSWRWRRSTSPGAAPGPRGGPGGGRSRSWRSRPSPSSLPSGSWTVTTSSCGLLVSCQATSMPRPMWKDHSCGSSGRRRTFQPPPLR